MTERIKSPGRRRVEQFFVRGMAKVFGFLARIIPLRVFQRIGNVGGLLIMACSPWRQKLADRNLQAAFGDRYDARARRRIRRLVCQGISKTMLELLKIPHMTPDQIRRIISVEGIEHLREAVAAGKGGIILTAHYGNWELVNAAVLIEGLPVSVVARDAPDDFVAGTINAARERHGGHVVDQYDVRGMLEVLRRGELLGILPDQHAKHGGLLGTFLGVPASLAPGPATFAVRTHCAVIPCFSYRQPDDTFKCRIFPPLQLISTGDRDRDVALNTQLLMDVIGEQIREHPEQWLWLHDRWRPHDATKRITPEDE
jgi:KDO2-lipid IV(A) lauroyltransferase